MQFTTIFFDLDDTLYPSTTGLWEAIKARMNLYMLERVGIPANDIPWLREKYFREYGTTLRGLQANHGVDVQDFLAFVHNLPLDQYLRPDPSQQAVLASLPTRNLVFTNADSAHARRVMRVLQIEDYFSDIIDVNRMDPYCKPKPEAFAVAMKAAGENDPAKCVMIDDLARTTRMAKELGLFSILYKATHAGSTISSDADRTLSDWNKLSALLNGKRI